MGASRTSSFAYKGRELSAAEIAGELKVAHILEGSVRKSGNRVRITARLIDTGSDRHLWSETFDRELTDVFTIQDEIANAIVGALRETLGEKAAAPVVVRADTENVQAYDLYLKARELFIARSEVEDRLHELAETFAVSIWGYAVMSNHLHVVVQVLPEAVTGWKAEEIAAHCAPSGGGQSAPPAGPLGR